MASSGIDVSVSFNCDGAAIDEAQAYYSPLFSQFPQNKRSLFVSTLWERDPFQGEWDLMCDTYSAIRALLTEQKISLQVWMAHATDPLGIVKRDQYMASMGWTLLRDEEGSYKLERTGGRLVPRAGKITSRLNLLMSCLQGGLPVANPRQMIKILSDRSSQVMHMTTATAGAREPPVKTSDALLAMARSNPAMAMSRLFEIPPDHAWVANGVQVRYVDNFGDLDRAEAAPATSQSCTGWPAQQNTQQQAPQHAEDAAQNGRRGSLYGEGVDGHQNDGKSHGSLPLSNQSVC